MEEPSHSLSVGTDELRGEQGKMWHHLEIISICYSSALPCDWEQNRNTTLTLNWFVGSFDWHANSHSTGRKAYLETKTKLQKYKKKFSKILSAIPTQNISSLQVFKYSICSLFLKTLRCVMRLTFQGNFGIEIPNLLPLPLHFRKGSRKESGSKIN